MLLAPSQSVHYIYNNNDYSHANLCSNSSIFIQAKQKHSLVTCLNYTVPVRARRQIIYPTEKLGGNNPSERVLKEQVGASNA